MQINTIEKLQNTDYINTKPQGVFNDIKLNILNIIENLINPKELTAQEELNNKFLQLDFGSEFDIDATKISQADAVFFVSLLNQENLINYEVKDNSLEITTFDNKKINATNSLLNMLKTSLDTNKPIRLDFDKDITVILKLDKEGKVQAHFIPGTAEIESYLKNNIQSLRQTFDDEQIKYSYLGYSKKQDERQKRSKK